MRLGARSALEGVASRGAGWALVLLLFAGCSLLGKGALDDKPLESELTGGGGAGGDDPVGGGGGTPGCMSHTECPGVDTTCRVRLCDDGQCTFLNAEPLTSCSENDGTVCDGDGGCVECIDQAQCTGDESCVQNLCVPPHCVDNMQNADETDVDCGGDGCGPCDNGLGCVAWSDCKSKFCDGDVCKPCAESEDCALVPGTYCDGGTCSPQKVLNDLCEGADECTSGYCVDDVCCNAACGGECRTCSGGDGMCKPVPMGLDYDGECGADPMAPCGPTGEGCNGAQASGCILAASGTSCGAASCMGGVEVTESTCDGAGLCASGMMNPCAPYVCGGSGCLSSCSSKSDCAAADDYCNSSGSCVACGTAPGGSVTTQSCTQQSPCSSYSCPAGGPCVVNCDGNGACQGATINCPNGYDCMVVCGNGNNVCRDLTLNCNGASNCDISCSSAMNGCTDAQVNCGIGACSGSCASTIPSFSCNQSCDCEPC